MPRPLMLSVCIWGLILWLARLSPLAAKVKLISKSVWRFNGALYKSPGGLGARGVLTSPGVVNCNSVARC
jgi:hypothetical protein